MKQLITALTSLGHTENTMILQIVINYGTPNLTIGNVLTDNTDLTFILATLNALITEIKHL